VSASGRNARRKRMWRTALNRAPEQHLEPKRTEESELLDLRFRLGSRLHLVEFQKPFSEKSNLARVLADIVGIKYPAGEFIELLRFNCAQIAGADLGSVGNGLERDPRILRSRSSCRTLLMDATRLIPF